MASKSSSDSTVDTAESPSPWGFAARLVFSILIILHLVIVFVMLASSLAEFAVEGVGPSPLLVDVQMATSPYTETFYFDLLAKRYYLTFARPDDCDLRVEVLPKGSDPTVDANWIPISENGLPGGPTQRRFDAITRHQILYNAIEQESITGAIAKRMAMHYESITGKTPGRVRFRRHYLVDNQDIVNRTVAADPNHESKFDTIYSAIIFGKGAEIEVLKVTDESQVARPE